MHAFTFQIIIIINVIRIFEIIEKEICIYIYPSNQHCRYEISKFALKTIWTEANCRSNYSKSNFRREKRTARKTSSFGIEHSNHWIERFHSRPILFCRKWDLNWAGSPLENCFHGAHGGKLNPLRLWNVM